MTWQYPEEVDEQLPVVKPGFEDEYERQLIEDARRAELYWALHREGSGY